MAIDCVLAGVIGFRGRMKSPLHNVKQKSCWPASRGAAVFAAALCLVCGLMGIARSQEPAAETIPLSGPSFVPDGGFHGSTLAGWHILGQADWRADQGEIVGKGTGSGGAGWLVLDRSFHDTGLYTSFECVGPCDTGVLLRLHPTAEGMQGTYLAIRDGDLKAYNLTLDNSVGKRFWSHLDDYFDADAYGPAVLYWYKTVRNPKAPGGAELIPHLIHNRSGAGSDVLAVDLNGDGKMDVVTSTRSGTYIFWGTGKTQAKQSAK